MHPIVVTAAGAAPALLAMWYYDRLDAKRPEPRGLRRKVAIFSALAVVPVIAVGFGLMGMTPPTPTGAALFQAFVVAAAVEEAAKLSVLRLTIWKRLEFNEHMDGIVYGARAGLGFALVENILYLMQHDDLQGLMITFVLRAVMAVPGHAIWGGLIGYFVAVRRIDGKGPGALGGYLLATALHGTYDAAIFLQGPLRLEGYNVAANALLLVPFAVIIFGALGLRRCARRALAADDMAEARAGGISSPPDGASAPSPP